MDAVSKKEVKALRLANNVWSDKYFAIAIGAMMVLAIVCHWATVFYFRGRCRDIRVGRLYHKICCRLSAPIPLVRVASGRALLYTIYWSINLILALTNVELENPSYVGA
ncbi:hypothetical protein AWENTII_007593 [Aspergillus wentii]